MTDNDAEFNLSVNTTVIPTVNCTQCNALTPRVLTQSLSCVQPHRRFFFCPTCWANIPLINLRSACLYRIREEAASPPVNGETNGGSQ